MRSLRSTCGVSRKQRCRNSYVREWCGLKEYEVTGLERGNTGSVGGINKEIQKKKRVSRKLVFGALRLSSLREPAMFVCLCRREWGRASGDDPWGGFRATPEIGVVHADSLIFYG
ncbi:hypothetical protein EVAR_61939_1 [Eumeta japonica]|uniref:Uncharacterized protein n=1 Tax=Eumeta variegata TaxID=151549 RepID=A0A4C1ZG18_EUMVA|nr:hypothetical protein EVAR_61939_1 [Eumeta japonica]